MSRILLVDDSPHAQRIGERILTDEGYEVVTVSNGDSALIRLDDVAPELVLLKASLPGRSGFEICRFIKMSPRHRHVKVILTEAATETLAAADVLQAGADGTIKKPFEATALLDAVRPLVAAASEQKGGPAMLAAASGPNAAAASSKPAEPKTTAPMIAVIDPEQVRAAVTIALDAALPALVEDVTQRVIAALTNRRGGTDRMDARSTPLAAVAAAGTPAPVGVPQAASAAEPVRHVSRLSGSAVRAPGRLRPGSILGLNLDAETSPAEPDSSN